MDKVRERILDVAHDPTNRTIILILARDMYDGSSGLTSDQIRKETKLSAEAIADALFALCEAGLVETWGKGPATIYSLTEQGHEMAL